MSAKLYNAASIFFYFKKILEKYYFRKCTIIDPNVLIMVNSGM